MLYDTGITKMNLISKIGSFYPNLTQKIENYLNGIYMGNETTVISVIPGSKTENCDVET
jgi:hypothetical protein